MSQSERLDRLDRDLSSRGPQDSRGEAYHHLSTSVTASLPGGSYYLHFSHQQEKAHEVPSDVHNPSSPLHVSWGLPIGFHLRGRWALGHLASWLVGCADWHGPARWARPEAGHGGGEKRARRPSVPRRRCNPVASAALWPLHALGYRRAAWAWSGRWGSVFPHMEGEACGQERPRVLHSWEEREDRGQ